MATEYMLSYTAEEIDEKLGKVDIIPDYEQNNETSFDYIKNRPFYDIGDRTVEYLPYEERELSYNPDNMPGWLIESTFESGENVPQAGKYYDVTIDGTTYHCLAKDCYGTVAIGDMAFSGTAEPFACLLDPDGVMAGEANFYMFVILMDLPEDTTVAATKTFSISVTCVESGLKMIPDKYQHKTDWENNDEDSAGHLLNRPFYDYYKPIYTFDGNFDGKEVVYPTGHPDESFIKISDIPMTSAELLGKRIRSNDLTAFGIEGLTIMEGVIAESDITTTDNYIHVGVKCHEQFGSLYVISVTADSATISEWSDMVLTKGLWFYSVDIIYIAELSERKFKQLDEKFIPSSVSGDTGNSLPEVTTTDNGKLLQVVDGVWTAVAITDGNEVEY